MDKETIAELLDDKYETLFSWLEQQDPDHWEIGPEGKWTTGQQALHLLQSVKPLNTALSLPKFILKYKFGTSNRNVRKYKAVIQRYEERLKGAKGMTFKGSRNMKAPEVNEKSYLINRLRTESKKLQYKTKKWKDKDLDNLILPHPLMGKMPVREILMWSAYHVEHHTKTLMDNY